MSTTMMVKEIGTAFNWRLFGLLMGLGILGLIAVMPYGLTVAGQNWGQEQVGTLVPQFLVNLAMLAIQIGLGLLMANRVGLGLPILSTWLQGHNTGRYLENILSAAGLGVLVGAAVVLLDLYVFAPRMEAEFQSLSAALPGNANPPAWQGLLASFYGGINEEILNRLFLMTLVVWLGSLVGRTGNGVFWLAILLTGLLFGLGHLPGAVAMGIPLTPLYIGRTLLLNASGLLFGWLYWRWGLESAMVAHLCVDLVVHVLGALLAV
jgi:hypothetical protein